MNQLNHLDNYREESSCSSYQEEEEEEAREDFCENLKEKDTHTKKSYLKYLLEPGDPLY